ncbi:eukaryotic translation initiation factor 2-alpha kinase-like isoform X2 [Pogonomyrmex barbatus]|uniref:non-specific serine/threonine protein kinase n=1 Tax=Pogonomyrmex barbatus TaxID=144034 RepID=A0A6I9VZF2_9HYME|nr:eukaryotic translation initiation factor 2-alpha kinase-like isoform X2 [Pogonomyrmex barbatus]
MSRLWQICFYCTVLFAFTCSLGSAEDTIKLSLCGEQSKNIRSLMLVSTLDGKISAIDAGNYGDLLWSLDFNDGPMLSSNIHRRELGNNGQWIRLIPSLDGDLYKFDGENLETLPVTADTLLHSSFRYSDDLVFAGGKVIHSYGVLADTGKILYQCGVSGCNNDTDQQRYMEQDVLIIQRHQQTVRAVEARTGNERWNFSVGQHNVELVSSADCSNKDVALDIEIKVVIPDGLVWAINKSNPTVKLWQYKFDSPIVTIWREDTKADTATVTPGNSLKEIDLFDSSQWVWGSEYSSVSPRLYIGMHERQLYVQENHGHKHNHKNLLDSKFIQVRYRWQPYPAVGNGFYLYSTEQCNHDDSNILRISDMEKPTLNYTENENKIFIHGTSLWYYWREVLFISFGTAIVLNFSLTRILNSLTTVVKDAIPTPLIVERHVEIEKNDSTNDDGENVNNFKSRYLMDFEPVDCLGKGGYGVVFEAKNKIDDCNYAIKRIALPNSQDSRERVMREVKALAKLDHHNIVRYFNAWLECPPPGWQEEHDQQWINQLKYSSSEYLSETQTETKPDDSVYINVTQTDPSSVESACEALELDNINMNDDSYITFEKSNEEQYDNNAIYINTCSTDNSNLSTSSNVNEKEWSEINEIDRSESIVFEETDNNVTTDKKENKSRKRQKSLSLDLNKKPNTHKSAKMFLYIQMQLCQRLSLREWLKQHTSTRDFPRVLNIFQQIVDAVEYVHLHGLIHRDLKPSNIFFAYDDKIKIGDFGLVTAMTESYDKSHTPEAENENISLKNSLHTACVGTHLYMSPEQMNGQIYNYKVDIYSLGIIFFELLTPFSTDMERVVELSNLKKSVFPQNFAEKYPAEYNLLKMMLDKDPANRPTTLGIKAKPPLQNYETTDFNTDKDSKWHFELPPLSRHSSVTNSSSSGELLESMI